MSLSVASPISKHHPKRIICEPKITFLEVLVPPMAIQLPDQANAPKSNDDYLEILEWLGLVVLDSPRIHPNDSIDPHLCQYEIPNPEEVCMTPLVKLTWHALLSAEWITKVLLNCLYVDSPRLALAR